MNAATMKDTAKQSFEMYKSAFESAFRYQEKLSKGVEVFANLDYDDINKTPKDLVFQIDKMKLYHYRPLVKNPLAVPVMITYALMNRTKALSKVFWNSGWICTSSTGGTPRPKTCT